MEAYFDQLIDQRRAEPSDDLLSALIAASDGEDRLTQREIGLTLSLIYAAGFETTTNLIGNMVHTLIRHADELARLRADESLVPGAVDEVLRYQPPVQVDARYTFEDVEIGGTPSPREAWCSCSWGGHRDPDVIDDPDRFDIGRRETPLLSFGSGIHYCLGASLARLEGQVVLAGLLNRFETWTPTGS